MHHSLGKAALMGKRDPLHHRQGQWLILVAEQLQVRKEERTRSLRMHMSHIKGYFIQGYITAMLILV